MTIREYELDKLLSFCRDRALSFEANYSESSDELELRVGGAGTAEYLYMKRVPSISYFISIWEEQNIKANE